MRRARARRLAAVAMVSVSQALCSRSLPQVLTRRGVVRSRSRLRRVSGAATTSAWSWRWPSVAAWTAERRAASPLGPVQLYHLFGVGMQEPGQPGAVAPVPSIAHTRWPGR